MTVITAIKNRKEADNETHIIFGIFIGSIGDFVRDRYIPTLDRVQEFRKKTGSESRKDRDSPRAEGG